jgi:hypothetical protein
MQNFNPRFACDYYLKTTKHGQISLRDHKSKTNNLWKPHAKWPWEAGFHIQLLPIQTTCTNSMLDVTPCFYTYYVIDSLVEFLITQLPPFSDPFTPNLYKSILFFLWLGNILLKRVHENTQTHSKDNTPSISFYKQK